MADLTKQAAKPVRVRREVLREQAMGLRMAGLSYREIGRAIGRSHEESRRLVVEALDETRARTAEETERLREQELRRADAVIGAHWAKRSDPKNARIILLASERRARLLGLDAAIKLEPVPPQDGHRMDYSLLSTEELLTLRVLHQKARGAVPSLPAPASESTVDVTPMPMPEAQA